MKLSQFDRLEGADDVVRTLVLEEALVESRTQVPMVALVIFVPIKSPDAADDDERADAIVPKIAQKMKAKIGAAGGPFESNVVEDHKLRHGGVVRGVTLPNLARTGMVA